MHFILCSVITLLFGYVKYTIIIVTTKYMAIKSVTTKRRVIQFIEYKEISIAMFLRETGLKRGFLDSDKLESSTSDVFITKIIAEYPEISLKWLVFGEGNMLTLSIEDDGVTNNKVAESQSNYDHPCEECKKMKSDIKNLKNQIILQNKLITMYERAEKE